MGKNNQNEWLCQLPLAKIDRTKIARASKFNWLQQTRDEWPNRSKIRSSPVVYNKQVVAQRW